MNLEEQIKTLKSDKVQLGEQILQIENSKITLLEFTHTEIERMRYFSIMSISTSMCYTDY